MGRQLGTALGFLGLQLGTALGFLLFHTSLGAVLFTTDSGQSLAFFRFQGRPTVSFFFGKALFSESLFLFVPCSSLVL